MRKLIPLFALLILSSCAGFGKQPLSSSLLDSSSMQPPQATFDLPEIRLGDVRYGKDRTREKEAFAWHFFPKGEFRRGVPREDVEEYDSIKVKVYEVGSIENGKFRGFNLERWDVMEETVRALGRPQVKNYHNYFLRSDDELIFLPAMTKGAPGSVLWARGEKDVISFLRDRWHLGLRADKRFLVNELKAERRVQIPGEGAFEAASYGESISATEVRMGRPTVLASLPRGKEVLRVPGDWIVFLYPDGLAVHLKRQ